VCLLVEGPVLREVVTAAVHDLAARTHHRFSDGLSAVGASGCVIGQGGVEAALATVVQLHGFHWFTG